MRRPRILAVAILTFLTLAASPAGAYSVLAHEALIDEVWENEVVPLLRGRFGNLSAEQLRQARAHAYGGSLIQDFGYYPFGSRLFSNIVHYVRSGEFVAALIEEAGDADELAFALGALAHYASDNTGHPGAVNRAVPAVYPKLRDRHGDEVLYAHSPARHVMVEFAFDVVQVARGAFTSDVYQDLIGFEVSVPVLTRAFERTYGLELEQVVGNLDLAIGTYRRAASEIIPDVTRTAWMDKREEILARSPKAVEDDVVFVLTPQQYDEQYGTAYRKPGLLSRIVVAIFKVIPKFGPFKPLAFEPLTPEAERLLLESFAASRDRYRELLRSAGAGRLSLTDTDLDTGVPPARGVNPLADETYADLLDELANNDFVNVPAPLREAINHHFAAARVAQGPASRRDRRAVRQLAALNAAGNRR
jgi:hypothetical protein